MAETANDYETRTDMFWILDGDHKPVPATIKQWGKFRREKDGRRVVLTQLPDCWVSTVFLGMDHGYGEGPPVLFETMAFKGQYADGTVNEVEDSTDRYATWDDAVAGHEAIVNRLQLGKTGG
jgi:hypothetical protein